MTRLWKVAIVLAGMMLISMAAPALAQEDARLKQLAEVMKASMEEQKQMHIAMDIKMELVDIDVEIPTMTMEMWQDDGNIRFEMPMQNILTIVTEKELCLYVGEAGVMLYAPEETMAKLTEQRDEVLKKLGLPTNQDEMFLAMIEKGALRITGEETVDGVDCWVVEIDMEMMEAMAELGMAFSPMGALGGGEQMPTFKAVGMHLGKEDGAPRRMNMEMTMTLPGQVVETDMKMEMTTTDLEFGIDVPEELFAFDVPDDASTVTWTPDKTVEEVKKEFDEAVLKGMAAAGGGGVQQQ